jgi:anti-sigma B factor antagonist
MTFTMTHHGSVTVIALQGNLMGGPDATQLNSTLHERVREGNKQIVVDLGGVEFMNSSGLSLLIGGATIMKTAGGALKLANASGRISSLLKITKLGSVFETFSTVDEAVASFGR